MQNFFALRKIPESLIGTGPLIFRTLDRIQDPNDPRRRKIEGCIAELEKEIYDY
jgi:hypothetical protein